MTIKKYEEPLEGELLPRDKGSYVTVQLCGRQNGKSAQLDKFVSELTVQYLRITIGRYKDGHLVTEKPVQGEVIED